MVELNLTTTEIPPGESRAVEVGGTRVAIFNVEGSFHAIENDCPHRGASLEAGDFSGTTVACPLHGWQFDVTDGKCLTQPGTAARQFTVSVEGERISLEAKPEEVTPNGNGIHRYLVRYGKLGWVAQFGSIEQFDCQHRGRVVLNTSRGIELGEMLSDSDRGIPTGEKPTGEVLRLATEDDEQTAVEMSVEPADLFADCQRLLADRGLPIEVVDFERLLDGETVVLYFLGEQVPELEAVDAALSQARPFKVRLYPMVEPPPGSGGCGSGNCGGGGCGQN